MRYAHYAGKYAKGTLIYSDGKTTNGKHGSNYARTRMDFIDLRVSGSNDNSDSIFPDSGCTEVFKSK